MTPTTGQRIPQASLREEWSVSSVQQLAWSMGRPPSTPSISSMLGTPGTASRASNRSERSESDEGADPARRARRAEALRRLAADPHATPAERDLALQRLAAMRTTYRTAC